MTAVSNFSLFQYTISYHTKYIHVHFTNLMLKICETRTLNFSLHSPILWTLAMQNNKVVKK